MLEGDKHKVFANKYDSLYYESEYFDRWILVIKSMISNLQSIDPERFAIERDYRGHLDLPGRGNFMGEFRQV